METERWIKISTKLLYWQHDLHPQAAEEVACSAFAWIDLIGLAAWKDGSDYKRGQVRGASVRFLAVRWNWSTNRVMRFLNRLEEAERIVWIRNANTGRKSGRITICNYEDYQTTRYAGGDASGDASGDKEVEGRSRIRKERAIREQVDPDVAEVWAHYVELRKAMVPGARDLVLTDKRKTKIVNRLHEYPLADLKHAITGMLNSDWHVANGHTDIELCLRNPEQVDRFLGMYDRVKPETNEGAWGRAYLDSIGKVRST